MKRLFGLLLVIVLAGVPWLALDTPHAQAQYQDTYAAIAYSPSSGSFGYATRQPSRYIAEQIALRNTFGMDARVVVWVRNGWCALSLGMTHGVAGYAWSLDSPFDAERRALQECRLRTGGCYIAASVSSWE